ncbi:Ppx/GppA phosphatase family protein [Calothrix sp. NIES-3974]|uniref:Ppx/GppA phosphatase family protein n=1 Tax=Calothrix sp. NIES-3974 TaxID=2005462 RepID=UPI000B5E0A71|nr:Ppx/GppA phosphatase family protein [Calothrix sp. NIES-3974]BAZ03378.1 exopolyphosphatase [Calothrix sp. NIES-3974]
MVDLVSPADEQTSRTPGEPQIIAAIDLGTNSLHMVIVQIEPTLPSFSIIAREKETVRLGDRDLQTGNLKPEIMDRAINTLRRFREIARTLKAQSIVAVATSAVREAPNGRELLRRVEDEVGLEVDLISGQEEARRIYLGVLSGMEFNNQPHVIIDIGGGSTEIILGDRSEERVLTSTKIGAVRLSTEFITTDPISDQEFNYLQAYARGMLERSVEAVLASLPFGENPKLVGTSGTIETLAMIHACEHLGNELNMINGYEFTLDYLQDLINRLRRMNYQERAAIPGMSDRRAEVILAGAVILQEAMVLLKVKSITLCERALREGIIVDWMLTHGLIENRLRFQGSVRRRSVLKTAKKYQVNLQHSDRVANFALSLFDQTQGILHHWGDTERHLFWAASILHNSGHYVSHSSHHKHSYYLIRHGELLGYTETEIEIIANIARYHRKSPPKKKHENFRNLNHREHREIVAKLSSLLRLATALDRRQIGAISHIRLHYQLESHQIILQVFPTHPNDDCALEMWSLEYSKSVFEQEFKLKLIPQLQPTVITGVRE